ncbi:hypothetical protein K437DRAFT_253818 [Tilletiaria anomala UBC 951]|uniref:J domain-containing protein n=1 Tax=Tilletiaria anomala (strain ATCC 24038 / CBS 436.72 / UBC 951) TaxID=1037660 RepID=A0A066WJZ9_TILAU|nr:uncharacterized protein K437DRAFT_253818 [Tilletiaria anomala UBC 951]KDN52873.1 hypothetical protein K437DRAFT_253818 [Tilletiaria anomala UBC 951]
MVARHTEPKILVKLRDDWTRVRDARRNSSKRKGGDCSMSHLLSRHGHNRTRKSSSERQLRKRPRQPASPSPSRGASQPSDEPGPSSRSRRAPVRDAGDEEWGTKLADLEAEDFSHLADGWERFQSSYEQELAYEEAGMPFEAGSASKASRYAALHGGAYGAYEDAAMPKVDIPKRYMDKLGNTGADFLKRGGMDMDDEQYAEYVREGMWRRSNASYIRDQEERARQETKRKAEKEEKAHRRRERAKRREKEAKRQRFEEEQFALREARKKWEDRWTQLRAAKAGETTDPLWFSDLPWPCLSMWNGDLNPVLTKEAISRFLLAPDGLDADKAASAASARTRLRTALLRYHPDRFLSAPWYARIPEASHLREKVRECVLQIARILNELQAEQREKEASKGHVP